MTAISAHLRDRTREAFAITREIEVIRNFVNCDLYVRKPELVAEQRPRFAEPGERLLVHLSNFRPVKRVLDVVEVFARVAGAGACAADADRRRARPLRRRVPGAPTSAYSTAVTSSASRTT